MTTNFTLTKENITFVLNSESHTMPLGKNFNKVMELVKKNKFAEIFKLLSPKKAIEQILRGLKVISGEHIQYNGVDFYEHDYRGLVEYITKCIDSKLPYEYLLKFLENLSLNTDKNSKLNIFHFMKQTGIHITSNGYIAAVKSVKSNLLDHHTGTFKNEIGTFVKEKRKELNNDPKVGCGRGLHVGGTGYVYSFGSNSRILLILLHPKDVVSIPDDCSHQKLRCCKYYVACELNNEAQSLWKQGKFATNINDMLIDFDKELIIDESKEFAASAKSAEKQLKKANKIQKNAPKVEKKEKIIPEKQVTKDVKKPTEKVIIDKSITINGKPIVIQKSAPKNKAPEKKPVDRDKTIKTPAVTIVLKTISRGRLSLPNKVLKRIHAHPGDELMLYSSETALILSKTQRNGEESTCVYKVDRDGQLCISEIRLKEINHGMFFRVDIVNNTIKITGGGKN